MGSNPSGMHLPQLTLRDLFCLVLVCALAIGWWPEKRAYVSLQTQIAATGDFTVSGYFDPMLWRALK